MSTKASKFELNVLKEVLMLLLFQNWCMHHLLGFVISILRNWMWLDKLFVKAHRWGLTKNLYSTDELFAKRDQQLYTAMFCNSHCLNYIYILPIGVDPADPAAAGPIIWVIIHFISLLPFQSRGKDRDYWHFWAIVKQMIKVLILCLFMSLFLVRYC